jgi:hypothetical protein
MVRSQFRRARSPAVWGDRYAVPRQGARQARRPGRVTLVFQVVKDAVLPALAESRRALLAPWDGLETLLDES